jgi:hypothetical protein
MHVEWRPIQYRPVKILITSIREVVVDNNVDTFDINASAKQVGGHYIITISSNEKQVEIKSMIVKSEVSPTYLIFAYGTL